MKEKYRTLSKNVLLFAISGVVPKALAFIIIPIYTNYLSTADYGIYELVLTTVDLLLPIFALRIHEAVLKFALDKNYDEKVIFSSGIKINFIGTCVVGVGSYIVSLFDVIDKSNLIAFVALFFIVGNTHVITRFCRAIDKVGVITIASIANTVVMFICNIVFLTIFNWGLNGFLFATFLGYFACTCVCFFGAKLYKYLVIATPFSTIKKMVAFSFPLIFSALAWWINNASDRYIVTAICGVSASGIYSVAYKIPSLLATVQDVFMQAWSVSAIKEYDNEDSDGFIGNIYSMLQFGMVVAASVLMILNMPIAKIIYANEFFAAWEFVPPLLVSLYFNAMALFLDGLFIATSKTKIIAYFTGIGAVVNLVLNFILIYLIGPYGAALATMIGFGVGYLLRVIYGRKCFKIKRNVPREIIVIIILIVQIVVSFLKWKMIIPQILAFAFIAVMYKKEFKQFLHMIKGRLSRKQNSET